MCNTVAFVGSTEVSGERTTYVADTSHVITPGHECTLILVERKIRSVYFQSRLAYTALIATRKQQNLIKNERKVAAKSTCPGHDNNCPILSREVRLVLASSTNRHAV